jgi:hypothetical protein
MIGVEECDVGAYELHVYKYECQIQGSTIENFRGVTTSLSNVKRICIAICILAFEQLGQTVHHVHHTYTRGGS